MHGIASNCLAVFPVMTVMAVITVMTVFPVMAVITVMAVFPVMAVITVMAVIQYSDGSVSSDASVFSA